MTTINALVHGKPKKAQIKATDRQVYEEQIAANKESFEAEIAALNRRAKYMSEDEYREARRELKRYWFEIRKPKRPGKAGNVGSFLTPARPR